MPIKDKIEYKELFCQICDEKTSHVKVDTMEGKAWQCENCATFKKGAVTK